MWCDANTEQALCDEIAKLPPLPDRNVVILLPEQNPIRIPSLIESLRRQQVPFCGAVFPSLIVGSESKDRGAILLHMPVHCAPVLIRDLSTPAVYADELSVIPPLDQHDTVLVLVDGLAANIGTLLQTLATKVGRTPHYFGGGAGSAMLQSIPCIFNPDGLFHDAALLVPLRQRSAQGVRHGWSKLGGPFTANQTYETTIVELDGRKAFDVYKETVEEKTDHTVTLDTFSSIGALHPFGMIKNGAERVVRDPIKVDARGGLVCVGDVPENVTVEILKGDPISLIKTSAVAARDCLVSNDFITQTVLVADCISRRMYLQDRFKEELSAVEHVLTRHASGVVLQGMLTLGEISTHGKGYLNFLNKTIVVCSLGYERISKK